LLIELELVPPNQEWELGAETISAN